MPSHDEFFPGDDLISDPTDVSHRSIEIDAAAKDIWPWLVQMGYHRGGWYIDSWWDRAINRYFWPLLVPKEARATYRAPLENIVPELQHLERGDVVPDGPPGSAFFTVEVLQHAHVLGLLSKTHVKYMTPKFLWNTRVAAHGEFSWAFILEPLDSGKTRLTIRMRARFGPKALRMILIPGLAFADATHVRQMLLGIKRRAESSRPAATDIAA
jgi:hypothetical protein